MARGRRIGVVVLLHEALIPKEYMYDSARISFRSVDMLTSPVQQTPRLAALVT
jgi:hypothetical protein